MVAKRSTSSLLTLDLRRDEFVELRSGNLGVRLAESAAEKDAARALRYRVFYEEMGAKPSEQAIRTKRDYDDFDEYADYLLVIDHNKTDVMERVVGTYRLLPQDKAESIGKFYSNGEYDLSILQEYPGKLLEVGRSCVAPAYRGRAAMQLLWEGIAFYIFIHHIDILFGCASLPGTNLDDHAEGLTYLYHTHLAPPALRVPALPERYVEMQRLDPHHLDHRRALIRLPPLIKGYLRLGGYVGDGAVIDEQFNTTDVAVIVKTELFADKYYRHYERRLRDALE
ncbi:GNAT family N-acetyltransferase [Commensalibacter oyaizuii]|uniref:L-ornithine N(alpha)-acyltransferase n=1 Tax=Commensalibacter oyaizuii TaxID=3043873 RepID=A0ABT6Q3P7_9PROT|nr:GNAT family N-acyltransferase [Commensalibacter sp. TBRC 16381]MDI2091727.1 GNAT family N-acyltransferase [Commensalibacter sp. TBRC 16381]